MKKKFRGRGQNPIFLPKNTNFFQKLIFFSRKIGPSGGRAPPCPPGYALAEESKMADDCQIANVQTQRANENQFRNSFIENENSSRKSKLESTSIILGYLQHIEREINFISCKRIEDRNCTTEYLSLIHI